jgi:hypothetical protein
MFQGAGNAADQVAHPLEIEAALEFPLDHFADQGRLGPFFSECASSERLTLWFGKTDGEGGFHVGKLDECKTDCKTKAGEL